MQPQNASQSGEYPPSGVSKDRINFFIFAMGFDFVLFGAFAIICARIAHNIKSTIYVCMLLTFICLVAVAYNFNNLNLGGEKGGLISEIVMDIIFFALFWVVSIHLESKELSLSDIPRVVKAYFLLQGIFFFFHFLNPRNDFSLKHN